MADVVILGAGLTGLSTAYHLEQLGFNDYVLFEKDLEVGGLCRSVVSEGFTFDYTGHLLHINDIYFKSFIEKRYVELDCAKSSLDLNSLEMRLDEALGKETRESLEEWLKLKRSIKK